MTEILAVEGENEVASTSPTTKGMIHLTNTVVGGKKQVKTLVVLGSNKVKSATSISNWIVKDSDLSNKGYNFASNQESEQAGEQEAENEGRSGEHQAIVQEEGGI